MVSAGVIESQFPYLYNEYNGDDDENDNFLIDLCVCIEEVHTCKQLE